MTIIIAITCEYSILNVINVQFALVVREGGDDHGGHEGGNDGGVGVHHGPLLGQARHGGAGHEARPEDPEKQSSQQRENI